MRAVHLREDDPRLFKVWVNRTLYKIFCKNIKMFNKMLRDQGDGFWIKFCSSLKYVLEKEGYAVKIIMTEEDYFEIFFINFLDCLTCKQETVQTLVNDVVSVARFSNLFKSTDFYQGYNDKNNYSSLCRLFDPGSSAQDFTGKMNSFAFHGRMWFTLPLYLRAIGSLLSVFDMWLYVPEIQNIEWDMPTSWLYSSEELPADGLYEHHLKKRWGKKLEAMLGIDTDFINFWDSPEPNSEDEKRSLIYVSRTSELGQLMNSMLEDSAVTFELRLFDNFASKYFHTYEFIRESLRGFSIILKHENYRTAYLVANARQLYITNQGEMFHPYSQFVFIFWNSAFGSRFWTNKNGMDCILHKWQKFVISDNYYKQRFSKKRLRIECLCLPMATMCEAKKAMYLDSRFHDTLDSGTAWDSPEVVVRLLWNMPLCLNWLEIVLMNVYKFEAVLLPFIHVPVHKSVKALVERLYVKYSKEARFLVKSAIIVSEYIRVNEDQDVGRCYTERLALKFAIKMLVPILKFLIGPAYKVVSVISHENSPLGEYVDSSEDEDESCDDSIKKINYLRISYDTAFPNLVAATHIPSVDDIFSCNRRTILYWIGKTKCPPFKETRPYAKDVAQALLAYETSINSRDSDNNSKPTKSDPLYNYDKEIFKEACYAIFGFKHINPVESAVIIVTKMFELLDEDGWAKFDVANEFLLTLSPDIKKLTQILERSSLFNETTVRLLLVLENLGLVYLLCACVLGDTLDYKIPDQNLLTKIIHAECRSAMADVAMRFIVLCLKFMKSGRVPCPLKLATYRNFKQPEFDRLENISLSIAEHLVSDSVNTDSQYIERISSLPPLKVPNLKKISKGRMEPYFLFLKNLFDLRFNFLHKISEKQLEKSFISSKKDSPVDNVLFYNSNIVEYRLVEEMAALQKCLELGEEYRQNARRLVVLLQHRVRSLIKQFIKWSGADTYPAQIAAPLSPVNAKCVAVVSKIRTAALLIPLQSIFTVYLTSYGTLHPICQNTLDVSVEWQDFVLKMIHSPASEVYGNENITDFYDSVRYMILEYMNNLLNDCIKVWNVKQLCCKPMKIVDKYSPLHAEKIYTTLLHLSLICAYNGLLDSDTYSEGVIFLKKISKEFISAEALLRKSAVDSSANWFETCNLLKPVYKKLYESLISTIQTLKPECDSVPHWRGYDDVYLCLFMDLRKSNGISNPLECLQLNEFLSKDFKVKENKEIVNKTKDLPKAASKSSDSNNENAKGKKNKDKRNAERKCQFDSENKISIVEDKDVQNNEGKGHSNSKNKEDKVEDDDASQTETCEVNVKKYTDISIEKRGRKRYVVKKTVVQTIQILKEPESSNDGKEEVANTSSNKSKPKTDKHDQCKDSNGDIASVLDNVSELSKQDKKRLRKKAKRERYKLNKQKNTDKQSPNTNEEANTSDSTNKQALVEVDAATVGNNELQTLTIPSKFKQQLEEFKNKDMNGIIKQFNNIPNTKHESKNCLESDGAAKTVNTAVSDIKTKQQNSQLTQLKQCFECGMVEPYRKAYKKCKLCADYKWRVHRYYCSNICQRTAWKNKHCDEHRRGEVLTEQTSASS